MESKNQKSTSSERVVEAPAGVYSGLMQEARSVDNPSSKKVSPNQLINANALVENDVSKPLKSGVLTKAFSGLMERSSVKVNKEKETNDGNRKLNSLLSDRRSKVRQPEVRSDGVYSVRPKEEVRNNYVKFTHKPTSSKVNNEQSSLNNISVVANTKTAINDNMSLLPNSYSNAVKSAVVSGQTSRVKMPDGTYAGSRILKDRPQQENDTVCVTIETSNEWGAINVSDSPRPVNLEQANTLFNYVMYKGDQLLKALNTTSSNSLIHVPSNVEFSKPMNLKDLVLCGYKLDSLDSMISKADMITGKFFMAVKNLFGAGIPLDIIHSHLRKCNCELAIIDITEFKQFDDCIVKVFNSLYSQSDEKCVPEKLDWAASMEGDKTLDPFSILSKADLVKAGVHKNGNEIVDHTKFIDEIDEETRFKIRTVYSHISEYIMKQIKGFKIKKLVKTTDSYIIDFKSNNEYVNLFLNNFILHRDDIVDTFMTSLESIVSVYVVICDMLSCKKAQNHKFINYVDVKSKKDSRSKSYYKIALPEKSSDEDERDYAMLKMLFEQSHTQIDETRYNTIEQLDEDLKEALLTVVNMMDQLMTSYFSRLGSGHDCMVCCSMKMLFGSKHFLSTMAKWTSKSRSNVGQLDYSFINRLTKWCVDMTKSPEVLEYDPDSVTSCDAFSICMSVASAMKKVVTGDANITEIKRTEQGLLVPGVNQENMTYAISALMLKTEQWSRMGASSIILNCKYNSKSASKHVKVKTCQIFLPIHQLNRISITKNYRIPSKYAYGSSKMNTDEVLAFLNVIVLNDEDDQISMTADTRKELLLTCVKAMIEKLSLTDVYQVDKEANYPRAKFKEGVNMTIDQFTSLIKRIKDESGVDEVGKSKALTEYVKLIKLTTARYLADNRMIRWNNIKVALKMQHLGDTYLAPFSIINVAKYKKLVDAVITSEVEELSL